MCVCVCVCACAKERGGRARRGEVMRVSTASTTPSEVRMPIAVEPSCAGGAKKSARVSKRASVSAKDRCARPVAQRRVGFRLRGAADRAACGACARPARWCSGAQRGARAQQQRRAAAATQQKRAPVVRACTAGDERHKRARACLDGLDGVLHLHAHAAAAPPRQRLRQGHTAADAQAASEKACVVYVRVCVRVPGTGGLRG